MSKSNNLTDFLTSLADKFRLVLDKTEKINPQNFEDKVTEVYDKGYADGQSQGGGDNYYDTFWDNYQDMGNRTDYISQFNGKYWNDENFRPKYDIDVGKSGGQFAYQSQFSQFKKGRNGEEDLQIDTSKLTGGYSFFAGNPNIKKLPTFDLSVCTMGSNIFADCTSLEEISIIVTAQTNFNEMFKNCPSLVDLMVSGTIGKTSSNLKTSTNLSKASITSIINALDDTKNNLSITLSIEARDKAFGDSSSDEWKNLENSKPTWNISVI